MQSRLSSLAGLASLVASCSPVGKDAQAEQSACEISTDYVAHLVQGAVRYRADNPSAPRSIAVREVPYQLLPTVTEDGIVEGELADNIPDVADWREITKLSSESVVNTCPTLKSWLSDQAILSEDEKTVPLMKGDKWDVQVLTIAMPILTNDKRHAVVFASMQAGGLAGVGVLAVYSKDNTGKWQLVREETRWVS